MSCKRRRRLLFIFISLLLLLLLLACYGGMEYEDLPMIMALW